MPVSSTGMTNSICHTRIVITGLDPVIHVDAPDKPGHDGRSVPQMEYVMAGPGPGHPRLGRVYRSRNLAPG